MKCLSVKGELAEAKVFRPEILDASTKVYVFRPLAGMVVAENCTSGRFPSSHASMDWKCSSLP